MERIGEIDFFRVVAIALMVVFHFIYDLNEFVNININYESGFWYYIGKIAAILFIVVSGVSSNFSKNKMKNAVKLLGYGILVSVATYFVFKDMYVRFGILHFLAIMTLSSIFLNRLNLLSLFLIQSFSLFFYILSERIRIDTFWLIPFGFKYYGFTTVDYYPIFPYIIFYILGIFIYRFIYSKGKRILQFEIKSNIIELVSKKSLAIYILHQPILLVIIFIIKNILN